jgi:hypothetical protein
MALLPRISHSGISARMSLDDFLWNIQTFTFSDELQLGGSFQLWKFEILHLRRIVFDFVLDCIDPIA